MNEKARVGVLGLGHWGPNLARNLNAIGKLAAFCDQNPALRQEFEAQYPGKAVFENAEAMYSSEVVNSVVIATPAATHGILAEKALKANKHVFVEKPLCLDVAQAERLKALSIERGLALMVGHLLLYHPAFEAMKHLIHGGELGRIRYIYSNRLSLGKIRREENALWSFAPHDVSMILALIGKMPEEIVATGGHYLTHGVDDTTLTHMTFQENIRAHIFVSWLHPFKDHKMVVVCEKGMVVFDDTFPPEEKLKLYRHSVEWNGDLPEVTKANSVNVEIDWVEPLRKECETFIRCVEEGVPPFSDASEGIRVLKVLHASQKSIHAGKHVFLKGDEYV